MYSLLNILQRFYTSHALLYHATFSNVPSDLRTGLHNVNPEHLYSQIKWLKKYFDIVSIDEFLKSSDFGRVAITFDDAYESVFKEAIPVLDNLSVPCTIYINGCSLDRKPFWRDKVRFLINNSLVREFLNLYSKGSDYGHSLTEENFYQMTKEPSINGMPPKRIPLSMLELKTV